jgi:hypothetical protein
MTDRTPTTVNRTLRRLSNAEYRPREYLTDRDGSGKVAAHKLRLSILAWGLGHIPEIGSPLGRLRVGANFS